MALLCSSFLALAASAPGETRIVFMHINESGGTTWMRWLAEYDKRSCSGEVAIRPPGCSVTQKICSLKGPTFATEHWRGRTAMTMIIDFVETGCTFVELHHWDVAAAHAFRALGYRMMTIVREPLSRAASSFNYVYAQNLVQVASRSAEAATAAETSAPADAIAFARTVRSPDRTLGFLAGCQHCCQGLPHLKGDAPGYVPPSNASKFSDYDPQYSHYCSDWPQDCLRLAAEAEATAKQLGFGPGAPHGSCRDPRKLVSVAKSTLTGFDFVGVLEHMNGTVALFCAQYGICFSPETLSLHLNTHPHYLDVHTDEKAASVMSERLHPDRELYRHAVELFNTGLNKWQAA